MNKIFQLAKSALTVLSLTIFLMGSLHATIITDPLNGTTQVHVAYSQANTGVTLTFTSDGDGTFTLSMPAGVTYVPSSFTFTSPSGATVAESDISNLSAPVFAVTGGTVAGSVTMNYQIEANCAIQGSASIGVSVTISQTQILAVFRLLY
ncbi:MAG: hypothetical protein R2795_13800 [Saprospiraceae bacterium]